MKTLLKLFLKPYLKIWSGYFILHLVILIFFPPISTQKNVGYDSFIVGLTQVYITFSPIIMLFAFDKFKLNIKWMINSSFTRLELLRYFFLSHSLKFLLVTTPYFLYLFKHFEHLKPRLIKYLDSVANSPTN